jgi:hypothetical protein
MRVDHRRRDVGMPEKFLDGSNVMATLKQVRRKRMPERVT